MSGIRIPHLFWPQKNQAAVSVTVFLLAMAACMKIPVSDENLRLDTAYWSNVRHEDLYDAPLWPAVCELVQWNPEQESYEEAQLRTAGKMPEGLRYYFYIRTLEGSWENGGMQAVVLGDDPEKGRKLVEGAAEALRFHGLHAKAGVLEELLSVAEVVPPRLEAALSRDAPDEEFENLWRQIDAFDKHYDTADPGMDVYARIVQHARAHPEEYTPSKGTDATMDLLAGSDRFHNPSAGFSITKPRGWRFASMEQVLAYRAAARLKDREMEKQIREKAGPPLVVMVRYPEPHGGLNPSAQVMLRPAGPLKDKTAVEQLRLLLPAIQSSMADFILKTPIQKTRVSGLSAAHMKAEYTVANMDGRAFSTLFRMWLIPRGDDIFMLSMSGPREGPDVSEKEFKTILDSIHIQE